MRNLVSRRPVLFSVLAIVLYVAGMQALAAVLEHLRWPELAVLLVAQGLFCGYVAALIAYFGWWGDAGFTKPISGRALLAYSPWVLLPILMVAGSEIHGAGAGRVIGFAAFTLLVGFGEEGLLRGVVLRALLPRGAMSAAFLSSLFFGVAHLSNVFEGKDLFSVAVQVVYAVLIGIGFAGPRLFTGTIWPAVVLHGLIDFADLASRSFTRVPEGQSTTPGQAVTVIGITGAYALYGWWLLRRYRRSQGRFENPPVSTDEDRARG